MATQIINHSVQIPINVHHASGRTDRFRRHPAFASLVTWMAVLVSRPRRPVVVLDEIHPTTLAQYREAIAIAAASLDPVVSAVARQRACQAALDRLDVLSTIPRAQLQDPDYRTLVAAQITDAVLGVHRCHLAYGPVAQVRFE